MREGPATNAPSHRSPARPISRAAVAVGILALAVLIAAAMSGLGARWGWWHFRTGFSILRWSVYGGIALSIAALGLAAYTRPGSGHRGLPIAIFALAIGLAVTIIPLQWQRTARSVPPIHDITTDVSNPPRFVAIVPLRVDARNPVEYGGAQIAAQQQAAYPDIRPLVVDLSPTAAFERALRAAEEKGWTIAAAVPEEGRIEATDRTFWFGFRDDVVVRLTELDPNRTVIDVRSLSRVGGSDVGTNARRVRAYLRRIRR
ncbi:MAG: DUF1499 domain-containing protein [Gemmatimonadetes bacterium]|nr:DUF1499 domain-containing protein [Gemmatimonadota bacterium]